VANAVSDALGGATVPLPMTPRNVWAALAGFRQGGRLG
jgi:CO/xanthine dehydrogenase Mo-binding subunit